MRFPLALAALSLMAVQAHAQTAAPDAAAPASPSMTAPAPTDSAPAPAPRHHRQRMTLQQRFDRANTTHDGKLTLEQAKAGMPMVAKHFDAIDQEKKGYVTKDQIAAYAAARRAEHRAAKHGSAS